MKRVKGSPILNRPFSVLPVTYFLVEHNRKDGQIIRYIGPFIQPVEKDFESPFMVELKRLGVTAIPMGKDGNFVGKDSIFEKAQMLNPDFILANKGVLDSSDNPEVPHSSSRLEMYGHRNHFLRCWEEGYTEVAFGTGKWIGQKRIVAIWVFTSLRKPILIQVFPKTRDPDGTGKRGQPFLATLSNRELSNFVRKHKLIIEESEGIARILRNWIS